MSKPRPLNILRDRRPPLLPAATTLMALAALAALVLHTEPLHLLAPRVRYVHASSELARRSAIVQRDVTLGIKAYVCDDATEFQLRTLLHAVRNAYPALRVLVANDGPRHVKLAATDAYVRDVPVDRDAGISRGRNAMVNATTTPYFALMDDDQMFDVDGSDLGKVVDELRDGWEVVGLRVRNLPGIAEWEDEGVLVPRYVANVTAVKGRTVTLCVWNENAGPNVQTMRRALRVDVLHNALMARTETLRRVPWRNELKLNEHMTFFMDLKNAGVKVGYLPSVFVHHRARRESGCYAAVRGREEDFEELLDYTDDFEWADGCYDGFVKYAEQHLKRQGEEEDKDKDKEARGIGERPRELANRQETTGQGDVEQESVRKESVGQETVKQQPVRQVVAAR